MKNRMPAGGLRPALIALITVALATFAFGLTPAAHAARCNDNLPLRPGSCGQRVSDLQWLLAGHRPNVFTEVKGPFRHPVNGSYGARTKAALFQYRYRIGYPSKGQCGARTSTWQAPQVTGYFFNVLRGKAKRPACWVALAASRLKAVVAAQPSKTALAVRALELSWLGISEQPDGSNRGACISVSCTWHGAHLPALQSSTGAYGDAWCVSTQQTAFQLVGYGHFADNTAGVYYAADYYSARSMTFAKPKVGSLVAFIDFDRYGHRIPGTGHMGFVVAVQASSFTYTAGNDGNAVREHTISDGSRPYLFIRLAGVA